MLYSEVAVGHEEGSMGVQLVYKTLPQRPEVLRIYLGGDGKPWDGSQPSRDPSGSEALVLGLMERDSVNSIFLARPCYHQSIYNAECTPDLWTSGRYAERVVSAMTFALEKIILETQPQRVELVGYSGGGVLALLIGDRIESVQRVITVAANLDIDAWTGFHGHLGLDDSINPATLIYRQPQQERIHLQGALDEIVPVHTTDRYREKHPTDQFWVVDHFDHRCCWRQVWSEILQYPPDY